MLTLLLSIASGRACEVSGRSLLIQDYPGQHLKGRPRSFAPLALHPAAGGRLLAVASSRAFTPALPRKDC